jgi:hypothetical protein
MAEQQRRNFGGEIVMGRDRKSRFRQQPQPSDGERRRLASRSRLRVRHGDALQGRSRFFLVVGNLGRHNGTFHERSARTHKTRFRPIVKLLQTRFRHIVKLLRCDHMTHYEPERNAERED